jgi:hypothetical protein
MASGNTSANTGQYITTGTVSTASLSRWGFDLTEFTPILIQLESLDRIDDSSALAKGKQDSELHPAEVELKRGITEITQREQRSTANSRSYTTT